MWGTVYFHWISCLFKTSSSDLRTVLLMLSNTCSCSSVEPKRDSQSILEPSEDDQRQQVSIKRCRLVWVTARMLAFSIALQRRIEWISLVDAEVSFSSGATFLPGPYQPAGWANSLASSHPLIWLERTVPQTERHKRPADDSFQTTSLQKRPNQASIKYKRYKLCRIYSTTIQQF